MQEPQNIVVIEDLTSTIVDVANTDSAMAKKPRKLVNNNRAFLDGKCILADGTTYAMLRHGWRRMTAKENKYGRH